MQLNLQKPCTRRSRDGLFFLTSILTVLLATGQAAQAQATLVLDDFEDGVGKWTRNDKIKSENPSANVSLIDVVATKPAPGGFRDSKGAGMFAFKSASKSWASASLKVNGSQWSKIGANKLTFWLYADGQSEGTQLLLRGTSRGANGAPVDEVFELPQPVRLNVRSWRKVVIPLSDFKSPKGKLLWYLSTVNLLQFVQRGNWNSRFFSVDQLQVEGTGIAPSTPAPAPTATTAAEAPTTPPDAVIGAQVSVDYLRKQGRVRPSANASLGGAWQDSSGNIGFPLDSVTFRTALQALRPRFLRIEAASLTDLTDSSRPSFDFSRLKAAVTRARSIQVEPLIALTNPPEWGLDERGYTLFVTGAARAINPKGAKPTRYFELNTGAAMFNDTAAVRAYNQARTALRTISKTYRIGGIGANSTRTSTLTALLRGANGLDFLSLQYFGASSAGASEDALFGAARDLAAIRAAANALDKSRWRNAAIYVTQSNLNSARVPEEQTPADNRLTQMTAASWWTAFMINGSRLADQIFHNDAANPEWGLLDDRHAAYPAYYALWFWNTFLPPGSERVESRVVGASAATVSALAVNTPTAHNLLLTNTGEQEVTVKIAIRGFPILRQARWRLLSEETRTEPKGIRFAELPKSPFQTIKLTPHAVAALQFIEPPKKGR